MANVMQQASKTNVFNLVLCQRHGVARNPDDVVHDAKHADAVSKSSVRSIGVGSLRHSELAQMARVKRLVLFHHEPVFDDSMIEAVLNETRRFEEVSRSGHQVEVISAYDGLELTV